MNDTAQIITAFATLLAALGAAVAAIITAMKVNKTQQNVQKIETATNSMKDALVAATAKASKIEGNVQGRTDLLAEQEKKS